MHAKVLRELGFSLEYNLGKNPREKTPTHKLLSRYILMQKVGAKHVKAVLKTMSF